MSTRMVRIHKTNPKGQRLRALWVYQQRMARMIAELFCPACHTELEPGGCPRCGDF
jgi:hypothetical protein